MTASVLAALGLTDLVADTEEQYVRIAVGLAADRERRRELRSGLRGRMLASPLCDGAAFTHGWERALLALAGKA
jgi:predicted O-linked N-acetylglucosamine transferase (SPINDLY family)